jgi:succinate dehydrogenase / fumarate reductase iron-sulfur subunit
MIQLADARRIVGAATIDQAKLFNMDPSGSVLKAISDMGRDVFIQQVKDLFAR